MKVSWLHRAGKEQLILFCNGWAMDGQPFMPLDSKAYDVLMLNNYSDLQPDLDLKLVFNDYRKLYLVSWSMGVWAAQQLFGACDGLFSRAICLNGTLCPIHDQYGIPEKVFQATLQAWNETSRLKFYQRMCRDQTLISRFITCQPERTFEDQAKELEALQKLANCGSESQSIYSDIVIANKDFIIPTVNQLAFWQEREVCRVDGFHFLFYGFACWDEIVESAPAEYRKIFGS